MSHGCYNRPPYVQSYPAFDTNVKTLERTRVNIELKMATDCRYQADDQYADKGCIGCMHKEERSPETKQNSKQP